MAFDLNLGGFIPDSAFVNDSAVAEATAAAQLAIAQSNADAALAATQINSQAQIQTITTIAIIVGIVAVLFLILWFLK